DCQHERQTLRARSNAISRAGRLRSSLTLPDSKRQNRAPAASVRLVPLRGQGNLRSRKGEAVVGGTTIRRAHRTASPPGRPDGSHRGSGLARLADRNDHCDLPASGGLHKPAPAQGADAVSSSTVHNNREPGDSGRRLKHYWKKRPSPHSRARPFSLRAELSRSDTRGGFLYKYHSRRRHSVTRCELHQELSRPDCLQRSYFSQ